VAARGSPRRGRADGALVVALARGATVAEAAAEAGVSERTVFRRLQRDDFQRQVFDARRAMFEQASGALAASFTDAVSTLVELLGSQLDHVRLSAASRIMEWGSKVFETSELAARVAALEDRLESSDAKPPGLRSV
jgi:AcrR family transcriptional regulator